MKDRFKSLPNRARKRLLELAARVVNVAPTGPPERLHIQTRQLDAETKRRALLEKVRTRTCRNRVYLYYIEAVNSRDPAKIERTFQNARAQNAKAGKKIKRAYSRFNAKNRQSKFLYVGSSANILSRFRDHLGYGSRTVYSIQLAHWASGLALQLDFVCAKYPDGIAPDVIQVIEDTLWDRVRPMFGRRGAR